jgi:hypothetical protein
MDVSLKPISFFGPMIILRGLQTLKGLRDF